MTWDRGEGAVDERPEDEALLDELRSRRDRAEKLAESARIELRRAERISAACSAAIDQLDDQGSAVSLEDRVRRRA